MIYLASPYSHPEAAVRRARYLGAMKAVAWCLKKGLWVYSPIVACHDIAIKHKFPKDMTFWMDYNLEFIKRASALYVLELHGWLDSKGIEWESGEALNRGIPTYQMTILHNGHYEIIPNP